MGTSPVRADDLLRHAAFVRSLARSLVEDEHRAADVAQDTLLAALRAPAPRTPRAWLATVVRNCARRLFRDESRRARREQAAARRERLPSASERIAREELLRAVVGAVLDLDEPYRGTVLEHYYEGLSYREIARRASVSVETVRSRLKRARAQLRDHLRETHGSDGGSWACTLAALAGVHAARGVSGTAWGVMWMSKQAVVSIVAAALLLTVTVLLVRRGTDSFGRSEVADQGESKPGSAAATSADAGEEVRATDVATAQPGGPGAVARATGGQTKPYRVVGQTGDPASVTLRVHVVDETGAGYLGASVELITYALWRMTGSVEFQTDAGGWAEFRGRPPGKPQLVVLLGSTRQWIAFVELAEGSVTEATVVIPRAGASIEGQVRCRGEGPLDEAGVTLSARGEWFTDCLHARTGSGGHYRFEAVPPNTYGVAVGGDTLGLGTRRTADLIVAGAGALRHDIEIGFLCLSGVVRDATTRQPLPGVGVRLPTTAEHLTDAEGRYRFFDLSATGKLVLVKEGYELRFMDAGTVAPGAERVLDVDLRPAATLHLYVADDQGQPVTGEMRLEIVDRNDPTGTIITTPVAADADGHAVYRKIPPGSYEVGLRQGGSQWPAVEFEIHAGENALRFRLPTRAERETPMLAGTVRDAATGRPIAGASVRVFRFGMKTTTDEGGRFAFLRLPESDQELGIEKEGYAYAVVPATNLAKARTREVAIELKRGATLRLSVRIREGLDLPREVQLAFRQPKGQSGPQWGTSLTLDEEGCAVCRCVPPGRYRLYVISDDGAAGLDLDVALGETSVEVRLE